MLETVVVECTAAAIKYPTQPFQLNERAGNKCERVSTNCSPAEWRNVKLVSVGNKSEAVVRDGEERE